MAISPARCWSKACRETGVQVLPCIFWASLMKPWSICSERMLACATELAATHQHHQAINKGVWRETCAGPVPLDPSTAQPAKNSPGRKEKHPGKTSLLGSCVGPCHRGGKQKATLSESGVFGQKNPGFSLQERQQSPSTGWKKPPWLSFVSTGQSQWCGQGKKHK